MLISQHEGMADAASQTVNAASSMSAASMAFWTRADSNSETQLFCFCLLNSEPAKEVCGVVISSSACDAFPDSLLYSPFRKFRDRVQ